MLKKIYELFEGILKPNVINLNKFQPAPIQTIIPEEEGIVRTISEKDLSFETPYKILNHLSRIYMGGGRVSVMDLHKKYPLDECVAQQLGFIRREGENYILSQYARDLCERRMRNRP